MSRPKKCACGCGAAVAWSDKFQRWNKFVHGHNSAVIRAESEKCKVCGLPFDRPDIPARYPGDKRRGAVKGMCRPCYGKDRWRRLMKESPEKINAQRRASTQRLRKAVIDGLGGKCACCGVVELEFLTLDHVDGGGRKHRKEKGCWTAMYREVRDSNFKTKKYRVLCWNCNAAIGITGKVCPHKRKKK